ncbi:MAG: hypothetical protein AAGA87_08110 [Pseudomonadota bacterium]
MQLIFHIGAHCTGQDRLIRSLLKNRDVLAHNGVAVPGPGRYRRTLAEVVDKLQGAPASAETQDVILDAVLDFDAPQRIILSNENFLCTPDNVLLGNMLYGEIAKSAWLPATIPAAEPGFALTLRNVATFLPALTERQEDTSVTEAALSDTDPLQLSWFETVHGLRQANPDAPILVWCDEDAPLLWPEIMRTVAGVDETVPLTGDTDLIRTLLTDEGVDAMVDELTDDLTETERFNILTALIDEYAKEDEIEQEISLPDWTQDLIDDLTDAYDADVEKIATLPDVTVLAP